MKQTKGQQMLGGILSATEIEEYDALDVICEAFKDSSGRSPYHNIKLIERKTAIMKKATEVLRERLKSAELLAAGRPTALEDHFDRQKQLVNQIIDNQVTQKVMEIEKLVNQIIDNQVTQKVMEIENE